MLNLVDETHPSWVEQAIGSVEELLLDHAHCEKKAASTALSLIFRYPEYSELLQPLSALAREELAHFELVLSTLRSRGYEYRKLKPSAYAGRLMEKNRKEEPLRLLDTLICCALIEARSCERMKLLSIAFEGIDDELAQLYKGLLASEARHHSAYLTLAKHYFPTEAVRERLSQLSDHESAILSIPNEELRMHS